MPTELHVKFRRFLTIFGSLQHLIQLGRDFRMTKSRRTFTPEFKAQMVKLYENGKPRKDIISEYDLTPSALDKWVKQSQTSGSFKEKDNRTLEEELIKLRKENQRLLMENDILKQAALIIGRK
jgi:transposase